MATAGTAIEITLPTNNVSLNGTGNDADGDVVSYSWAQIAGPASGTMATSSNPGTLVTGLSAGVYEFELTVTDNKGAIGKDMVQVTVNDAVNIAPVANAGIASEITLPVSSVTLAGSGNDSDGTIAAYYWVKIAGPAAGTIVSNNSASTVVTDLTEGIYQFELIVTDNNGAMAQDVVQVKVNPTPNVAPVSNAGTDNIITLPINSVTLTGSANDTDGTIVSYSWVKISGPASGTIAATDAANTVVSDLTEGVYQFELTVTDDKGAIAKDVMQVTVNAAINLVPLSNAGTDNFITLPVNSAVLSGSANDSDGVIISYNWVKIAGPASGTIATADGASTAVTDLSEGTYLFQLTVADDKGATSSDTVQVTVNRAANLPPVANSGLDKVITLPLNTITLVGFGADADGAVMSYSWAKIAGPVSGTIAVSNTPTAIVSNMIQGVYSFELTVTDDMGEIAKDTVQVTVNPMPIISLVANAGDDKIITLPSSTVSMTGKGAIAGGTIATYNWTRIYGAPSALITNANTPTVTVGNLAHGTYKFELAVKDNKGAIAKDTIVVTVNYAPVSNAGVDKIITLPASTATLTGTGTDADGTVTYSWARVYGAPSASITTANAAITTVENLVHGTYKFELTVKDNNGAISKDTMVVTVNYAPVAKAGLDKVITLPINTVALAGTGTDADGTISTYSWAKIAGPAATIGTANAASTSVNSMVRGSYQFELTVKDNSGAISKDTVAITVNAAPVAKAGADKLITLPINTIALAGVGTDADSGVLSYNWVKIAGPAAGTIAVSNAASTTVNNMVRGVYQFELTVKDNYGAISKDIVVITVNAVPTVSAGADKIITMPAGTVTLSGTATDIDGTISSYSWTRIYGAPSATIATANTKTATIGNLLHGTYKFELAVKDNSGAIARDTVVVTVNYAPVVNAGLDKVITLPASSVSLNGIGTDADGTISTYTWTRIYGAPTASINAANSAAITVSNLLHGTYKFELAVKDNSGAIAKDTVVVTVNYAPVAKAGLDKMISLPVNTVTLAGTGTDGDGTISTYSWLKIAGPAATIGTANAASTTITSMVRGVYQFELTVKDNSGAISKDTVAVTVNAAPVAKAGADKLISLPINTVALVGTGTDGKVEC